MGLTTSRFVLPINSNMTNSSLVVIILNHTNEELNLEPQSPSLDHGHWMYTPNSRPPQMILAGENVVGFEVNNRVTFLWNVSYVGPNKFNRSCAIDAFTVKVLGGRGNQAVVVFVFELALRADPRLVDGVFTAMT
ncbi:uncharacterized protein B0J16DRAFT_359180 [Fusarium flagelliforme]|uniref:uncharacterized protein n=1 Tax=Fusarium flagelliforme TaxID=2675880 RepID=UPI001E8D13E9|nr:uncharacterized protein B0J16DRAFT_359180 [Fusarium flagelliforme]KAH7169675.1 hypothetical protein B0J16DRAFT_359180 [Fusarium flagelliforme]